MSRSPQNESKTNEVRDKRVLVYGLGRFGGGLGVIRYLAEKGAIVLVADDSSQDDLEPSIEQLTDVDVAGWFFDANGENLPNVDMLVVNPALRPDHAVFEFARSANAVVTTEIELFCAANRGKLVAITGSNGKSTTAAMVEHVLTETGRSCFLGGNFGGSLLSRLSEITADDVVLLELSSFQLSQANSTILRPDIAAITGFTPNHLDWHPSLEHYRSSKQRLLKSLRPDATAILPTDRQFDDWPTRSSRTYFGDDVGEPGVFDSDGAVVFRCGRMEEAIPAWSLRVPGRHNQWNSLAAAAICFQLGVPPTEIAEAVSSFTGVPMRLQTVGIHNGVRFVNDSASTTPESTVRAVSAFSQRPILIAGGADKGIDLAPIAATAAQGTNAAMWIGDTGDALSSLAKSLNSSLFQQCCGSLESAFAAAVDVAKPGDIVILSPGCSSFGMYANFQQRGQHFDELVRRLSQSERS